MTEGDTKPETTATAGDEKVSSADRLAQWRAAVDRYRDVATWAIGAFAAVGALLAGTAPLTGIGRIHPQRLWAVAAGSALGLLGVGLAIVAAVAATVPRSVYWHEIQAKEQGFWEKLLTGLGPLEDTLKRYPDSVLPPGIKSVDEIATAERNLQAAIGDLRVGAATTSDATRKELITQTALQLEDRLRQLGMARDELLLLARFEKARTTFRLSFLVMVVGALFAAGGLGTMLYGLGDTAAADKAEAEVASIKAATGKTDAETAKIKAELSQGSTAAPPSAADAPTITFALSKKGSMAFAQQLGAKCDTRRVRALLLSGDSAAGKWDLATIPSAICRSVRLTLTRDLGHLTS